MCCPERIASPAKKVIRTAGRLTANATAAKTSSLPHSTGSRFGTAENVERISPVEYSAVIESTPSTPKASWAKLTPARFAQRMEAKALLGTEIRPTGFEDDAGEDPDADDQRQRHEHGPAGGPDRPQLGPFRMRHPALGDRARDG